MAGQLFGNNVSYGGGIIQGRVSPVRQVTLEGPGHAGCGEGLMKPVELRRAAGQVVDKDWLSGSARF